MAVSRDTLARWYLPANTTECTELLAGTSIANPAHLYLFDEASGSILDRISSKDLALGSGDTAPAYQQFLPGWTKTCVRATAGAATRLLNTTFPNVNANSYTVVLLARLESPGATRTLLRFGNTFDDDAVIEQDGTGLRVGEGDATRSTLTTNVVGSHYFYTLRIDDAGNQVDAFYGATKITGGTQACNGTELCLGGNNTQHFFAPGAFYIWMGIWTSALADADIATLVARIKDGAPVVASGSGYSRSRVVNA